MIYTIGRHESYERYFIEQGCPQKLGKGLHNGLPYPGGSVWKTYQGANDYCQSHPEYQVYGVIADWEIDTEPAYGETHSLLKTSPLVQLPPATHVFQSEGFAWLRSTD